MEKLLTTSLSNSLVLGLVCQGFGGKGATGVAEKQLEASPISDRANASHWRRPSQLVMLVELVAYNIFKKG